MGKIKKILSEKVISSKSHYYPDFFTIEVCENFHIHWRNIRMNLLEEEFKTYTQAIKDSRKKWDILRRPYPYLSTIYLSPAWDKLPSECFNPTRMAIELQDVGKNNLPEIHFHYRNIRIDMNKKELLEMCELFNEAKENMK